MRGGPSLKVKGGLVGFRKNASLMVKRDGVILEKNSLILRKSGGFSKAPLQSIAK